MTLSRQLKDGCRAQPEGKAVSKKAVGYLPHQCLGLLSNTCQRTCTAKAVGMLQLCSFHFDRNISTRGIELGWAFSSQGCDGKKEEELACSKLN